MAARVLESRALEKGAETADRDLQLLASARAEAERLDVAPRAELRVWIGASAGGHLAELLELTARSASWCPRIDGLITTLPVGPELEARFERVCILGDCNRRTWWRAFTVALRAWSAVSGARPDVFVTTGSMPMLFVAAAAKLRGGRVIWIDSVARVDGLSMSAWVARSFVDLCLTQWPYVASQHRGVDYAGEVF